MTNGYERVAKAAEYWDAAREAFWGLPPSTQGRERALARQQVIAAERELIAALTEHEPSVRAAVVNNLRYVVQAGLYNDDSAFVECYNEAGKQVSGWGDSKG